MAEYPCAICRKPVAFEGDLPPLYPFCSRRCKLVDLGRWFREQYTIERDLTPEELGEPPPDMLSPGSMSADRDRPSNPDD